jgi:Holliday junction resolvasome RuvABC endonuclease subunit
MDSDTLYVGIDPSLTCTAMVCLPGDGPDIWKLAKGDLITRIMQYSAWVLGTVCDRSNGAREWVIAIEKPGGQLRGNAAWLLPLYADIVRQFIYRHRVIVYPVAPATLKKFATGSGRAEKSMMGQAVQRHWGDELPDGLLGNDAIDAFALAKLAQCIGNPAGDWTGYQQEIAVKQQRYQVEEVA